MSCLYHTLVMNNVTQVGDLLLQKEHLDFFKKSLSAWSNWKITEYGEDALPMSYCKLMYHWRKLRQIFKNKLEYLAHQGRKVDGAFIKPNGVIKKYKVSMMCSKCRFYDISRSDSNLMIFRMKVEFSEKNFAHGVNLATHQQQELKIIFNCFGI